MMPRRTPCRRPPLAAVQPSRSPSARRAPPPLKRVAPAAPARGTAPPAPRAPPAGGAPLTVAVDVDEGVERGGRRWEGADWARGDARRRDKTATARAVGPAAAAARAPGASRMRAVAIHPSSGVACASQRPNRPPLTIHTSPKPLVLGRFLHSLNKFVADEHSLSVSVSDYHVYEFAKVWGCSPDAANSIVHAFFESDHFAEGVPPIPGARDALGRMGGYCRLAVVTSRQHAIRDRTLAWLDAHFPGAFARGGVHFGNHWALEGASRTKAAMCADIGAAVLIDDNPLYARECAAAGMAVLLYDWDGGYPWSKLSGGQERDGATPDGITVVRDWGEVEAAVARIAAAAAAAGGEEE